MIDKQAVKFMESCASMGAKSMQALLRVINIVALKGPVENDCSLATLTPMK